ncbi:PTS sugar transporter subunit IIA [Clostridium sp. CF012]|uniref:PTS sugar transporter subunit IIA n=1 Tax=Clostridium sp. CF012 TaxID=2843319 RepID=UPI001C0D23BE|nr:PTS sugar transporter subunit IIA [Clostridium sp. CF012]MBU3143270.1 PTS sugar transporter subunit IIA [Clostridium sp. CF012]
MEISINQKWNILLLTHGNLGESLIEVSKMFVPESEDIHALGLYPTMGFEEFTHQVEIKLIELGKNTLILTDIFGGTPSNVSASFLKNNDYPIISGVNLAMVIEVLLNNNGNIDEISELVETTGINSIQNIRSKFIK